MFLFNAKLPLHTPLRVKIHSATGQSGAFEMIGCHTDLSEFVNNVGDEKFYALLQKLAKERRGDKLVKQFGLLNAVKKALQPNDTVFSIPLCKSLFRYCVREVSHLFDSFNPTAQTVHGPQFQLAILKIEESQNRILSITQEKQVSGLQLERGVKKVDIANDSDLRTGSRTPARQGIY